MPAGEILALVDQAGPDDLFLVAISGGSSALMSCPVEGISLQDEIDATDVLLKSGAGILEINAVRRHISQLNGGMLAARIAARGAELIGFGISDAVGTPPTGDISQPCTAYRGTPMGPGPDHPGGRPPGHPGLWSGGPAPPVRGGLSHDGGT